MSDWISFYKTYFANPQEAEEFVNKCEELQPSDSKHSAKIMMHQAQRLIYLADDLLNLKPKRESLPLLFLFICAENISKLYSSFTDEGQSRKYVQTFFAKFLSQADKNRLERTFVDSNTRNPLDVMRAIDLLYDIRCDVVHEGKYWEFSFRDDKTSMVNSNSCVEVYLSFRELRDIVVRCCITAVEDKLGVPSQIVAESCPKLKVY